MHTTSSEQQLTLDAKALGRALTAELPETLRRLRVDTLADSLAHGVPVSPLDTTIVLSAIDEQLTDPRMIEGADVEALLWTGVAAFCAEHGLPLPEGAAAALHAILSTAVRTDFLGPDADCPRQLFAPLQQMGIAPVARRRRHTGVGA